MDGGDGAHTMGLKDGRGGRPAMFSTHLDFLTLWEAGACSAR